MTAAGTLGSFSSHSAMVGLKGSSLLLRWRIEILLDGPPTHAQMPFDLADRPTLAPVQAMQVVDLIGGEHGAIPVIRQKPPVHQDVVVCKIPTAGAFAAEVLPEPAGDPCLTFWKAAWWCVWQIRRTSRDAKDICWRGR